MDSVRRVMVGLVRTVERYRFALAAFLILLTIQAIPEIIAGPYPIGWDVGAGVGTGARDSSRPPEGLGDSLEPVSRDRFQEIDFEERFQGTDFNIAISKTSLYPVISIV